MQRVDSVLCAVNITEACCGIVAKIDDPPIEAAIQSLIPSVQTVWGPYMDIAAVEAVYRMREADRQGIFDLDPGREKDGILEELYLAVLLAFVRGGQAAAAALNGAAVRDAARRAVGHGYRVIGREAAGDGRFAHGLDLTSPAHIAELRDVEDDLRWWIRKRVPRRRARIRALLEQFAAEPSARNGEGLREWVDGVRGLLADDSGRTVRAEVDTWAYRARNRGQVLALEDNDFSDAKYWNPLDDRTTRFCNWLNAPGRNVRTRVLRAWIKRYEKAKGRLSGDLDPEDPGVPEVPVYWLADPDSPNEAQWERDWRRGRIGIPGFHVYCRTEIRPA